MVESQPSKLLVAGSIPVSRSRFARSSQRSSVDLSPASSGRMIVAMAVLAILALLTWQTMEPGKFRSLTWVLLGFFAFRVMLGRARSR